MLRVNPSLRDVAIFMTYPHMSENGSYIFPLWAIWSVMCHIITREKNMLRVNPSLFDVARFFCYVSTYE